jgi:hypothetical protein
MQRVAGTYIAPRTVLARTIKGFMRQSIARSWPLPIQGHQGDPGAVAPQYPRASLVKTCSHRWQSLFLSAMTRLDNIYGYNAP